MYLIALLAVRVHKKINCLCSYHTYIVAKCSVRCSSVIHKYVSSFQLMSLLFDQRRIIYKARIIMNKYSQVDHSIIWIYGIYIMMMTKDTVLSCGQIQIICCARPVLGHSPLVYQLHERYMSIYIYIINIDEPKLMYWIPHGDTTKHQHP